MGLTLAIGLGPVLGGIVIELLEWSYIFLAPIPLIFIAMGMGIIFIPSVREHRSKTYDWVGYGPINMARLYCMSGLTNGQRSRWVSNYTIEYFLIATGGAISFILWQVRDVETLINISLFRDQNFALCTLITFVLGMENLGTGYAVPVLRQLVHGQNAFDADNMMLPAAIVVFVVLPFTGQLAGIITPRTGVTTGLMLFALGSLPMAGEDSNTPYLQLVIFSVIACGGMSFTMPCRMITAFRSLKSQQLNAGGGTINLFRRLGDSLGLNAWVEFLEMRTQYHRSIITATQSAYNSSRCEMSPNIGRLLDEASLPPPAHESVPLHYLEKVIHAKASTIGFQDRFLILTIGFLFAIIPAWPLGCQRPNR